jgi:hypothetical protein
MLEIVDVLLGRVMDREAELWYTKMRKGRDSNLW